MAQTQLYNFCKEHAIDVAQLVIDTKAYGDTDNKLVLYHGSKKGIVVDIAPISRDECDFGMIDGSVPIPFWKEASFERNRNLFCVCCSRPKKRLVIFITIPFENQFKECLTKLVGKDSIYHISKLLQDNENI